MNTEKGDAPRWMIPAVLAAGIGAVLALHFWSASRRLDTVPELVSAPPAAAYERQALEDGSVMELNRGAVAEVQFTADERRVRLLQGEADFTVAHDPRRPFVVHAAAVDVRAVGTAFDVRLDAGEVAVLVTEGRVRVRGTGPRSNFVSAGQRAVVGLDPAAPGPRIAAVSAEETDRLLAWQPKMLDFKSTPLGEVAAEFNRRNRLQLVVADAELARVPIAASFRSDNVEGFVHLLELTTDAQAVRSGDTIILRRSR